MRIRTIYDDILDATLKNYRLGAIAMLEAQLVRLCLNDAPEWRLMQPLYALAYLESFP